MRARRRLLLSTVALAAASAPALSLASPANAATGSAAVPQYIVNFTAIAGPPAPDGLPFHSTACAIGPAIDPIVVTCQESGVISFTAAGGSGRASISSVLADINWTYTLTRSTASAATTYRMVGTGTETVGTSPVLRPVRVTGTIMVKPTPDPTIHGTEDVYPRLTPAS